MKKPFVVTVDLMLRMSKKTESKMSAVIKGLNESSCIGEAGWRNHSNKACGIMSIYQNSVRYKITL